MLTSRIEALHRQLVATLEHSSTTQPELRGLVVGQAARYVGDRLPPNKAVAQHIIDDHIGVAYWPLNKAPKRKSSAEQILTPDRSRRSGVGRGGGVSRGGEPG
jgi:hypothetical protein